MLVSDKGESYHYLGVEFDIDKVSCSTAFKEECIFTSELLDADGVRVSKNKPSQVSLLFMSIL